jgi:hypothetical protein
MWHEMEVPPSPSKSTHLKRIGTFWIRISAVKRNCPDYFRGFIQSVQVAVSKAHRLLCVRTTRLTLINPTFCTQSVFIAFI